MRLLKAISCLRLDDGRNASRIVDGQVNIHNTLKRLH